MKRLFFILMGFMFAFAVLLTSCEGEKNDVVTYKVTVATSGNGSVAILNNGRTTIDIQSGLSVTVIATPDAGYEFVGWFVANTDVPASVVSEYTFIVEENVNLIAEFKQIFVPEAIDLGLPSGTKWASCNVGASRPEESGDYYAWGDCVVKDDYNWVTYIWADGAYNRILKYSTNGRYGTFDDKSVLDTEDDVASVKWGGNWRMPTYEEIKELKEECSWQWVTVNDMKGKLVTGPNGNSIFLPAAGRRSDTYLNSYESYGYYSTKTLDNNCDKSITLNFYHNYEYIGSENRYYGLSVRPVCD
ncbi:MAG: hypothetical protein J6V47_08805 [Bacteroidaceae bacterium]|nr:hypothetical protein [Bacteroidaceae bacterium]